MKSLLLALIFSFSIGAHADDNSWPGDIRAGQQTVEQLDREAQAPGLSPDAEAAIDRQRREAIRKIETIGDSRPDNAAAQVAVGKSLSAVAEAPRAKPFADRGITLAEASGDKKLLREALLAGSKVSYLLGDYASARKRAKRVLDDHPSDKDAFALYMLVKDRGAAAPTSSVGYAAGKTGQPSGAPASAAAAAGTASATAPEAPRAPVAEMTSAASLEAKKQITLGWSRLTLDPQAALKHFEAAITADPLSAAVRVERSKARLAAGDAGGALGDSDDAIRMDPKLGAGYAARAEAKRALGIKEAELLADLEAAANLDGRFQEDYRSAALRAGRGLPSGTAAAGGAASGGASSPDGPRPLLTNSAKGWGLMALIAALAAVLGGLIAPLLFRRRSDEDGSPPR